MYEEMQNEIISDSIIGYNSEIQVLPTSGPAVPPLPPGMGEKSDDDILSEMKTEDFEDVDVDLTEGDGTKVIDIEQKIGGRKKRRKQNSRSKKRRRRRKNRTKKN